MEAPANKPDSSREQPGTYDGPHKRCTQSNTICTDVNTGNVLRSSNVRGMRVKKSIDVDVRRQQSSCGTETTTTARFLSGHRHRLHYHLHFVLAQSSNLRGKQQFSFPSSSFFPKILRVKQSGGRQMRRRQGRPNRWHRSI